MTDKRLTSLPTDSATRKEYSLASGCYAYFPAALAGVARHSFVAGRKHTGGVLVHNRWKSDDAEDCVERHMMDIRDYEAAFSRMVGGPTPVEVQLILDEANALAWRAMEVSQKIHEKYGGAPLAPAARLAPESVAAAPVEKASTFEASQVPHIGGANACWCGAFHEMRPHHVHTKSIECWCGLVHGDGT